MFGTGKLSRVLWCTFHDIWFLVHLTINIFIFNFVKIAFSSKTTGKRNLLVHFCYCRYVITYLMRDMMNYHCLRVFRSRGKRIGKHSPGFSMFRTTVHGCSDAELCHVAIQSTVGAIFLLGNQYKPCQTGYQRGLKIQSYRWSRITSIVSNYFVNFRRVDILHLVETMTCPRVMLSKN